jgi:hypothetical protein
MVGFLQDFHGPMRVASRFCLRSLGIKSEVTAMAYEAPEGFPHIQRRGQLSEIVQGRQNVTYYKPVNFRQ